MNRTGILILRAITSLAAAYFMIQLFFPGRGWESILALAGFLLVGAYFLEYSKRGRK